MHYSCIETVGIVNYSCIEAIMRLFVELIAIRPEERDTGYIRPETFQCNNLIAYTERLSLDFNLPTVMC